MARQLQHLVEDPRPCSYLDDRDATLEHRILLDVTVQETEALLMRGWRRFGPDYFRPACPNCTRCVPTRVPTDLFRPSKSQRRARAKCAGLLKRVGKPTCDDERLDLYHRWHRSREEARDWTEANLDAKTYRFQFSMPHPAAREITYSDPATGRIVGVALSDQTPRVWSAIYFFYEPAWAKASIGTANVVFQMELARQKNIPHVYLGYQVDGCRSLEYKSTFRPQETLRRFPSFSEEPEWVAVGAGEGASG